MRVCISTVIKNERQYLDEWIQYHMELGVDHIFIFEDIDSETHEDITEKYDKVTLSRIDSILSEPHIKLIKNWKTSKANNPQYIYIKQMLLYIQLNYDYDWCFIIDNDEFITLENSEDLHKVVSLYNNYDAFIMQWKCYGASNHISKPDYSKGGLVYNYKKIMSGWVPNKSLESTTKTCYNLKTYKPNFFKYTHQPSDECNWCRTDFSKKRCEFIYDKIYLRHYISKSWEEYVWKKTKRGFLWGRKFQSFFDMNTDFIPIQKELMEALLDEILVVLPYKQSGSQGSELELALSLWSKNCTFKYHFVVIGEYDKSFEEKFPWVEFIKCSTKPKIDGQYNPHLDMINKFVIVSNKYKNKYNGFVWMVDDNYAIKQFTLFDILQTHYHSQSFTGNSKAPLNYWNHNKWKTRQLLDKENLPHINYTTHFPCWFDFEKLLAIIEKFDLMNESYVLEDVYFNYYEHEKPIKDDEIRLGIWNYDIYKREFQRALDNPSIKFMCNSVEGWSEDLENSLKKLYTPEKTGKQIDVVTKVVKYPPIQNKQNYLEDYDY